MAGPAPWVVVPSSQAVLADVVLVVASLGTEVLARELQQNASVFQMAARFRMTQPAALSVRRWEPSRPSAEKEVTGQQLEPGE